VENKEVAALTPEEAKRLLNAAENTRDRLLIHTLYETGCTVNELANLRVQDFHHATCTIHFTSDTTRNKTSRSSHASPTLCQELLHLTLHKQPTDKLFSGRQGAQLTTKRVRQIVQKLGEQTLGRQVNPQELRYTHIAHALGKNIPISAIQSQVGLDTLRMTQLAEQLTPKRVTNAYDAFFTKT